ncbi:hypothetical protein IEQ34_001641 [Dendrobium chrysotoxum]|uniref:Uncharacterized protein n=1 Tax=Dendrobium chrysotoxum TaxID=161865 RepID=A0AAV7HPT3_DENCH|nr:hypothetical protein IEQ34_001641 [Dendrobium chrysotoxum]
MHLTWNPWPQLGSIRTASPSANSRRQIAHSAAPAAGRPSPTENTTAGMASGGGTSECPEVGFSKSASGCRRRFRRWRWRRIRAPAVKPSASAKRRATMMIPMFLPKSPAPPNGAHSDDGGASGDSPKIFLLGSISNDWRERERERERERDETAGEEDRDRGFYK